MASIKQTPDGDWRIRVSKGTGKSRQYINETVRGNKKDAQKRVRDLETKIDLGSSPVEIKLTFRDHFIKWLSAIDGTVAPRTHSGYREYIERYMTSLYAVKLSEVTPHQIQSIYDSMQQRGLSSTTVRNLHAGLRACLSHAVRNESLRKNPCLSVDLPRRSRKEIVVLDTDEAPRFIEACRTAKNGLIFEVALETGMRPEEYLALRWRDLDIKRNTVSINQVVVYAGRGSGYSIETTKTKRSRRLIPISQALRDRLMEHRKQQNEYRLSCLVTYAGLDLIFANAVGKPFEETNLIRRDFRPILESCGLAGRGLTPYSLRHSCATLLLMAGENPKVVADRLGHASVTMTLDTYSHVLPHIQEAATNKLDNVLRMKSI